MAKRSRSDTDVQEPQLKRRRKEPLQLSTLPDEVLLKILSELPIATLSVCQTLSRHFNKLSIDSQIWKEKYYDRWVLPRALRIPGLRNPSSDPKSLLFSSKLSKWLDDDHLVKRGRETNWKRQYRLRHNWSKGTCKVNEVEVAQPPAPPLLVKFYRGIIVTADGNHGLRAWSMRDRGTILASIALRSSDVARRRLPSAITVGSAWGSAISATVVVGFNDSCFDLYSLLPENGGFVLRYSHDEAARSNISNGNGGFVTGVAFTESYLATLRGNQLVSLYRFDECNDEGSSRILNPPKLLSVLRADNVGSIVSLSLRTSSQGIVASIAYITTSISRNYMLALQELRLNPSDNKVGSRFTSTDPTDTQDRPYPPGFWPARVDLSSPTPSFISYGTLLSTNLRAISYSHPYLLVTSLDNTMTIYLVDSTPDSLTIRPGRRLWGHTSGIASAQVSDRGKAVSVTNTGNEMRIWELEEIISSGSRVPKADVNTQVYPLRSDRQERELIAGLSGAIERRGNGLGLALDEACRWVGFDDEQIVVLKQKQVVGTQMLSCYDFR